MTLMTKQRDHDVQKVVSKPDNFGCGGWIRTNDLRVMSEPRPVRLCRTRSALRCSSPVGDHVSVRSGGSPRELVCGGCDDKSDDTSHEPRQGFGVPRFVGLLCFRRSPGEPELPMAPRITSM